MQGALFIFLPVTINNVNLVGSEFLMSFLEGKLVSCLWYHDVHTFTWINGAVGKKKKKEKKRYILFKCILT